jgi:hypothetical protein
MPQILTTSAQIFCPHNGKGTTISSAPIWQIDSGFVTVENDVGVLSCPFAPLPCGGYQLRSMGLNASQINGRKVILVSDFNQTYTLLPLRIIESHQVLDDSTPAPLQPGQSAQPLSPELADSVPPVVAPALQVLAWPSTPPGPPLVVTFTLTTTFPLLWTLILISTPTKQKFELTNGIPSQVQVAPAGGAWPSSTFTVTVTLSPTFLAGLGKGPQDMYMTAVSKRGLSIYGQATITVI